jgi:hypothetical protein
VAPPPVPTPLSIMPSCLCSILCFYDCYDCSMFY